MTMLAITHEEVLQRQENLRRSMRPSHRAPGSGRVRRTIGRMIIAVGRAIHGGTVEQHPLPHVPQMTPTH